jgi:hypothetical protein
MRGIAVSYETIRRWCLKVGPRFAAAGIWVTCMCGLLPGPDISGAPWTWIARCSTATCRSGAIRRQPKRSYAGWWRDSRVNHG